MARQNFVGLVVSQGKMAKTVKVRVQTKGYDNRVHKEIMKRKDFLVHDEGNLCKEGDIVRIESVPKMSARKAFAVAEIKANRGQQFALYESLAKEKVAAEAASKGSQQARAQELLATTATRIADLKRLDLLTEAYKADAAQDRGVLLQEINRIKEKYDIASWPSTEPVVPLGLSVWAEQLSERERRLRELPVLLERILAPEHAAKCDAILRAALDAPELMKKATQKNVLRKWVLDPRNEVPK